MLLWRPSGVNHAEKMVDILEIVVYGRRGGKVMYRRIIAETRIYQFSS